MRRTKISGMDVLVMKLAVNGGARTVPEGLVKPWPWITEEDKNAVLEALDAGVLAHWGEHLPLLEREWAQYVGVKHCLATNSGTSALHMCVAAAGIRPGDEVITSAFTFLASASCVLHHNGIPVFADIDPRTYNIDPGKIEEKITEKTKAIIPVHIHGLPADMDRVNAVAERHGLTVIEDACQAHGAEYKGRKIGALGDMAAFSLNANKNMQAGEGGLFVTDDDDFKTRAEMVRTFGEVVKPGVPREYNAFVMGWMYRPNAMTAALARSQLKRLDDMNALRIRNCEYLTHNLLKIDGVQPPFVPKDVKHVYWAYVVRFKPETLGLSVQADAFRDAVVQALNAEGVPVGRWQTMPLPAQTLFQRREGYGYGCPWSCPHARKGIEYHVEDYPETLRYLRDYACVRGINPPNGLDLMEYYMEAFRKVFENLDPIVELAEKIERAEGAENR